MPSLTPGTVEHVPARNLTRIARAREALASGEAREARKTARVTVTEVAAELGVTPQAVSQWETGRRVPDAAHALAYARLLETLTRLRSPPARRAS